MNKLAPFKYFSPAFKHSMAWEIFIFFTSGNDRLTPLHFAARFKGTHSAGGYKKLYNRSTTSTITGNAPITCDSSHFSTITIYNLDQRTHYAVKAKYLWLTYFCRGAWAWRCWQRNGRGKERSWFARDRTVSQDGRQCEWERQVWVDTPPPRSHERERQRGRTARRLRRDRHWSEWKVLM